MTSSELAQTDVHSLVDNNLKALISFDRYYYCATIHDPEGDGSERHYDGKCLSFLENDGV